MKAIALQDYGKTQGLVVLDGYEIGYKSVEEIAKKKNIQVKKITFWWDNKKEHLKQIEIRGILLKGSDSTLHTTDNPSHVESLKKILMQLYDLEESDVFVEE